VGEQSKIEGKESKERAGKGRKEKGERRESNVR